jgi:hypothetical protein
LVELGMDSLAASLELRASIVNRESAKKTYRNRTVFEKA